ncbi:MAG: TolC family protein [Bdellovibrionales bacterium]
MKFAFSLLLFIPSVLNAAQTLSWPACVDMAVKKNSELLSSQRKLDSTADLEGVAKSGFFPTITGSLNYDRGNAVTAGTPTSAVPGANSQSSNRYTATLSGSENIFNGMQDVGKSRQAKANTQSSRAVLDTTRAKISFDLKSAYQGVLYAKDYEQFTADIIKRREANLNMVKLLFESGHENKGSLLLSQAYLEQARYEELQSRDSKRVAASQLARTLGLDEDLEFDIQDQIPVSEPAAKNPEMRSLASLTPDFKKAAADAESADAGITIARSQFFPTLAASGSVGKQGSEFFPTDTNRWSVGVALVFPLFNGGKDYYGTRSAAATWQSAEATRYNVNRDLLAKLQQAYTGYVEAVAKLRVDESFVRAATVHAEIARKRYNNGLMNFEDWDLVETDLINRRRSYLQSKRDRVIAEATWEQTQGKGVLP